MVVNAKVQLASVPEPKLPFGLYFHGKIATAANLKALARFQHLHILNLGSTELQDADLHELAGLKQLRALYLHGSKVTGAGLKQLTGLENLEYLHLNVLPVGDGLSDLASLKKLARPVLGLGEGDRCHPGSR